MRKKKLKIREVEANSVDFLFNINGNLGNFTLANGRGNDTSPVPCTGPSTKLGFICVFIP